MNSYKIYKALSRINLGAKLKSLAPSFFVVALSFFVMAEPSFAGLQKANTALEEIKGWAYGILGIGIFLYIMYHVVMALMNKGSWADVMMAVVYSAVAGGVLALGDWAWSIFA